MTRTEFVRVIEDLLETEAGSLTEDMRLADVGRWDSLAVMGFIAAADEHLGTSVPAQKIYACQTVSDVLGLVQDRFSG